MLIVGIDPSISRTSVTFGDSESTVKIRSVVVPPMRGGIRNKFCRYQSIVNRVAEILEGAESPVIFIEGYGFASQSAVRLAELGGLLRTLLLEITVNGGEIIEVPPTSLKLFVANHGHADKERMARAAYTHWGRAFENDDDCDSYCMWRFGRAYKGVDVVSAAQSLAVENVKNPVKKVRKKKKTGA